MSSSAGGSAAPGSGACSPLSAVIDGLAAVDLSAVTTASVGSVADDITELHHQLSRLHGQIVRRVAVIDAVNSGRIEGQVSTASWLRRACLVTHAQASGLVKTARTLRDKPASAAALEEGRISYPHAQILTSTFADLPSETHDAAEPILLDAAEKLDPGQLRTVAIRLRETINRDDAQRSADRDYARRRLHISPTLDGMFALDGLLDAEAGGILLSALTPLAKPLGPDDMRTPAQRRADALVEIAAQVLKTGHLPTVASHRPNVNVTLSLESLQKQSGTPGGELDWAGPITAEAARRIGCDATVRRIILGPDSEILDVGRSQRLVTPAQRTALAIRDKGCTWTGCDRPPWWTDAHHITPWADGGPTNLANLTLLCRTHHRQTHQGKQTGTIMRDGP